MTFGFSICAVPLQVTLVTYFGLELEILEGYQKMVKYIITNIERVVLVLVDFQNKLL